MQHCCHSTDCYFRQQHSYQCLDFLVKGLTFVVDILREKYCLDYLGECVNVVNANCREQHSVG